MKLDAVAFAGCALAILFCLACWAVLGIVLLDRYLHR